MKEALRALLEKQQYTLTGEHSAQKVCEYVKKSLTDKDVCYKQKFYGIQCHRCVQMTTAVNHCSNECVFCWRAMDFNEGMAIDSADSPEEIVEKSIQAQLTKINGFKGNENVNLRKFEEAQKPIHFAISLSGEPTLYPKLQEVIQVLNKKNISSFVVSNGMFPGRLKKINPTQLYLSIFAPNEKLYTEISRAKIKHPWQQLMKSLDVLKGKRKEGVRTCLRITLIKDMNMIKPENYAFLIKKADAMFVEVKAYMWVGFSRERMELKNMPLHNEVREFAEKIAEYADYKIIDEKKESRVVLLMKNDFDGRVLNFKNQAFWPGI